MFERAESPFQDRHRTRLWGLSVQCAENDYPDSVAQFIAFVHDHRVSRTLQSGNKSDAWTLTANAADFIVVNPYSAILLYSALSAVVNPCFMFISLQSLRIFLIEFPVIVRSDYHNNFVWSTLYSFIDYEVLESIYVQV